MKPIPFNNTYLDLGEDFYVRSPPTAVADPALVIFNHELGTALGLTGTGLDTPEGAAIFAGNRIPAGAAPLAMAYAGHQFGQFVPQLGDGRALLLGQVTAPDGTQHDIHLKGTGRTAFSRGGDGRAALGPVLREYLVSEAMARLGVPTTRALAAVTTGEQVARQEWLPGGVITRTARSFVRVGTFEYFAARDNQNAVTRLADYVIERDYPDCREADNPYLALLAAVTRRQAALIARWMQVGFIHGVMNTDNMSIAGETIDYGPCAFMDHYAHDRVYSSIDRFGRYAYNNQPNIGLWNLTRLAETLLPLLADSPDAAVEMAQATLNAYAGLYAHEWLQGMRAKIGLRSAQEDDRTLIEDLLDCMAGNRADFTLTFHYLSGLPLDTAAQDTDARALFAEPAAFDRWARGWRARLRGEGSGDSSRQVAMQQVNPVYIPRNHRIEAAIRAAEDRGDFSTFRELHAVLQQPYLRQSGADAYLLPPAPDEVVTQTFCGT
ncbi:MAG: YdiU family protein [Pseudomonadota bacterium]